ncbi:MAG: stage III sporulation protein AG [Lachnospiraceae bacterium]|nr:stage III sporulation protein AG [Lachnospiraceae bacterium]
MKLKEFFQNKLWKKWDKSQWMILALTGVLLMVIALPAERKQEEEGTGTDTKETMEAVTNQGDYVEELERKLQDTLAKIDGAGRVEVMITLEDSGESIVEKDTVSETSALQETDSAGGNRSEKNTQTSRSTVYQEGSDKTPFVGKEMTPKIAGVLVVAQGGENTAVKQNISEAVMALFQIEVNRIKVVKMNIQEEEY